MEDVDHKDILTIPNSAETEFFWRTTPCFIVKKGVLGIRTLLWFVVVQYGVFIAGR